MPAIFIQEGHRGCRGLMPENTIPAMIHALSFPVVALELDVVISKDKQVVVSHEAWFNHEISTKPDGGYITEEQEKAYNIYQMDYADVKIRCGHETTSPLYETTEITRIQNPCWLN